MTILEQRTMEVVSASMHKLAKETAKANRLKALELEEKFRFSGRDEMLTRLNTIMEEA